jgi:hypothetical protein
MVISASRRTDIPAFFNDWFLSSMKRGHVVVRNPYNYSQQRTISLSPSDVGAFVFWTRWPLPFFSSLDYLDRKHIPYYIMITINNYPRILEPDTPPVEKLGPVLDELASRIGPERIIWRYDPIVLSAETNLSFHKVNFDRLLRLTAGKCERVITSYLDLYRKVRKRFEKIGFVPEVPQRGTSEWIDLNHHLAAAAEGAGLQIQSCAEPCDAIPTPIKKGKCVDDELINRCLGGYLVFAKDKNQRRWCSCHRSVDIGTYGSCGFRCEYCYAR